LNYGEGKFRLTTEQGEYEAAIAVVASGTRPRCFNHLVLSETVQAYVHYEVAPLLHLQGNQIVIVGGGDAAFDYALNLGKKNQITILNRSESIKCLTLLWERVQAVKGICYCANTEVVSVSEGELGGIVIEHSSPDGLKLLQADYLIGALGREACRDFITPTLAEQAEDLQKQGMLYFIGDVKNERYRQTAIATGDGILAAMKIYEAVRHRLV
jgi:thioredoxin reductase (NADPH)